MVCYCFAKPSCLDVVQRYCAKGMESRLFLKANAICTSYVPTNFYMDFSYEIKIHFFEISFPEREREHYIYFAVNPLQFLFNLCTHFLFLFKKKTHKGNESSDFIYTHNLLIYFGEERKIICN